MFLENMTFSDNQHIINSLQIDFSIVEYSLKSEHLNTSDDLNDSVINLMLLADDNISDVSSTNTHSSKHLCFNITEKNSVSDFSVNTSDKSSTSTILIFQQHLINILDVSLINNTHSSKKLYFITVKENSVSDFSTNISNQISVSIILVFQQFSIITSLINTIHEKQDDMILIHSSSFDEDKNMQHDISDNKNLESVIDEIITHDNIATKDDLKEDEVSLSHAIHTAIKRCEQFSDECWKNFQNFFMLSKKNNNEINAYKLILFSDLEC